VATDIRKLRASELCRLLNSTPLGEAINERQLHRHRSRAGLRIGDERHVDLLRYIAWLVQVRHTPKPEPEGDPYARLKERSRARNIAIATAGRNIGELPPVAQPDRKAKSERDFQFFCKAYFPFLFYLPFSADHLKIIGKIEDAVLRGGLFAMAMPRASGKTTICECACIWAVLYGHRRYVFLIGSDAGHASQMLESIKTELIANDGLTDDFPEVIQPIVALGGIANRANGQLYHDERTHIGWTAEEIVLPTIPGSAASAAVVQVSGITGRVRGKKFKRADGHAARPDLVVLDDPQTDESARSPSQCATREAILAGAILNLAGPRTSISGIMPCTVIQPGDMADKILDREKHPEWNGERTKMVYAFPTSEALWQQYAQLRKDSLRAGGRGDAATRFYRRNRKAMDEGAVVAWPENFEPDELSGIQHAMNLKYRDEAAFWAEFQNEPLVQAEGETGLMSPDAIAAKLNAHQRGLIPLGATRVTMFVDVSQSVLWYLVAAWGDDFTGYVVDYGSWPDQNLEYFSLSSVRQTLQVAFPKAGVEAAIYAGLDALTKEIMGLEWRRDDGATMRIERCLVDANWGQSTDVIYQFCRQSAFAAALLPSHGRFVGASSQPMADYKRKPGDRVGHNWRVPNVAGKRAVRHILYDTNHWKSFVHARLAVPMGDPGCLSLFGDNPKRHRMLADHLTAEHPVRVEGRGRVVDEWKQRADRPDNHWLDCLVGAAVGASMQGSALAGVQTTSRSGPRKRLTIAELREQKLARHG
jgi:Terminase large subunit gpA, endonuclease domain